MSDARSGSASRRFDALGLVGVILLELVVFGLLSNSFLTASTLRTVVNQVPDLTVVAIGMTLVLVAGGIDLSVGSVLALGGSVFGLLLVDRGVPLPVAVVAALLVGAAAGLFNGLIVVGWSIPSFIVTLGTLEVARGLAYLVTDSQTEYVGSRIEGLARPVAGLGVSPAFLAALALVLIVQFLLSRTVPGRLLVAIGTNEEAVRLSGLDPRPVKLGAFVLSGLFAALAALFQVARLSSADPNGGIGLELSAIAAVVIGGTSLMGGRGSVLRSFLGVLIISLLQSGLASIGAQEPTKRVVTGLVIVLAVVADVHRGKLAGRWRRGRMKAEG
jgi:ribose transport system permease protein